MRARRIGVVEPLYWQTPPRPCTSTEARWRPKPRTNTACPSSWTRIKNTNAAHAAGDAEQREEVDAAVEAGGERRALAVDHHGGARALLAEQEEQRLVVRAVVVRRVDDRDVGADALVALRDAARALLERGHERA